MINKLGKEIHHNNKMKGFYEDEKNTGEMLALIHSEVSEALEADRKDRRCLPEIINVANAIESAQEFKFGFELRVKDTFEDELADTMIRVMDLAAFKGIDLEAHIEAKMRYNKLRPYKHGKNY